MAESVPKSTVSEQAAEETKPSPLIGGNGSHVEKAKALDLNALSDLEEKSETKENSPVKEIPQENTNKAEWRQENVIKKEKGYVSPIYFT